MLRLGSVLRSRLAQAMYPKCEKCEEILAPVVSTSAAVRSHGLAPSSAPEARSNWIGGCAITGRPLHKRPRGGGRNNNTASLLPSRGGQDITRKPQHKPDGGDQEGDPGIARRDREYDRRAADAKSSCGWHQRSTSPNTMSSEPRIAETSASRWPRQMKSIACRWAKPGARILHL